MTLPTINSLWRQNTTQDLLLLQRYLGLPVSNSSLTYLIEAMNSTAEILPAAVGSIQAMLDEIVSLEEAYVDEVDAGIAHQGNLKEYEGPIQGTNLTQDDRQTKLGPLEYDTSLLKERKVFADGVSAQGERLKRRSELTRMIRQALNLPGLQSDGLLVRS